MHRSFFAAAALALAACGGSVTTPGQSSSCTVTLSGALTGTYDCKPATAAWASSNNTGGFSFQVQQSGTTPQIDIAIGFPGEPHTGTYKSSDSGAQGGLSIQGSGGFWAATVGGSGGAQGSYTLNFTSVGNSIAGSGGKAYSTDGSLDATLPAVSGTGATGTVTVHATF